MRRHMALQDGNHKKTETKRPAKGAGLHRVNSHSHKNTINEHDTEHEHEINEHEHDMDT